VFTIQSFVGINDFDNIDITIYPNPVRQELTVNIIGLNGLTEIEIYDIAGRKINSENIIINQNKHQYKYNTTNIPTSTYMIIINNDNKKFVRRFIVE